MKTFKQFLQENIKSVADKKKWQILKPKGFLAKGFVPTKDNEKKSAN